METYKITFTIKTSNGADPSTLLEAAEQAVDDLIAHLESVGVEAKHDGDSGTSPSVESE